MKTPHIDSLAANGIRCTAGYVTAPQCSPSRAALMSGRYQQRFGHEGNPNFPLMLMRGGRILAEHLKAAGYATGHFGKWHLGFSDLGYAPKEIRESKDQMLPTQHGFDESFGYPEYDQAAVKGSDYEAYPVLFDRMTSWKSKEPLLKQIIGNGASERGGGDAKRNPGDSGKSEDRKKARKE